MDELIGQSVDRYEILELLGEGGMGAVYKARDVTLQRDVAIKVLHRHISRESDFEARFLQEARSAARLDHPGIVQVFDFSQARGRLYIVMKLIAGANLRQMLEELKKAGKWVPLEEGIQLVRQVSLTLDYAHHKGVLHRDIKPQNIMIEPEPGNGLPYRPVITDLGLAKLAEGSFVTRKGSSLGTPAYMSPEQALGQLTDVRSDVYSLGVLLYELTVGRVPFPARTITEAIRYHTTEIPPAPRSLRPDLPQALESIIQQALEKQPEKRFVDAAALARALESVTPEVSEAAAAPTLRENAVSLITQYQHSLEKPRGVSILKEFDTPADLSQDSIHVLVQGSIENSVTISKESITMGRLEDNDIVLNDISASRHHARVEFDGTNYRIVDLNSRNGTFLGNTRLLPGIAEIWPPEKAVRIGSAWLHLSRAQESRAGATAPLVESAVGGGEVKSHTGQRWVGILVDTKQLAVEPGGSVTATVSVMNQGPLVDHFQVSVEGIPVAWVVVPSALIRLMPGQQQAVTLTIQPPRSPSSKAGQHQMTVHVVSQNDPNQEARIDVVLVVAAYHQLGLDIRPQKQRSLKAGAFAVHVSNQCNTSLTVQLDAVDVEDGCQYTFDSPQIAVDVGQEKKCPLKVIPRTPLRGDTARPYPFTVTAHVAEGAGLTQQVQALWVQTPPAYSVNLQPLTQSGISKGTFTVQVMNLGQSDLPVQLTAADVEAACHYTFKPPQLTIPAGQDREVQLEVLPTAPLPTMEAKTCLFKVNVQPAETAGFGQQLQGEWVQIPPVLEVSVHEQAQGAESEGWFIVRANNRSAEPVTVHWEASSQKPECRYTFTPAHSVVPPGGEQQTQLRISYITPPPVNVAATHTFTVIARLAAAPQLTWHTQGEWVRTTPSQQVELMTPQQPAQPVEKSPHRFWGCLVMIIGLMITIAFGIFVGNIAFEVFNFGDTETWIAAILAWIIGIIITRNISRKVMNG